MSGKFNVMKAIQVAAKLLSFEHRSTMGRLRLVKLLYIADRKCLKETGRFMIGDHAVAMDCGPVHSTVYNMIKGESIHDKEWARYIRNDGPRDVQLHGSPGNSELSRHEIQILRRVSEDLMSQDDSDLINLTHLFGEYKKADSNREPKSSVRIPVEDIIEGVNRADDSEEILRDMNDASAFDAFFGRAS